MKFSHIVTFCSFFALAPVFAAELTRTVELSAEQSSAVFAVPNGFSFTRANATDAEGGSVSVSVGEPTTMNHVTLVPVAVNGEKVNGEGVNGEKVVVSVTFEDNGPLFTGRPAKVMREAIKEKVANPEDVELVPRDAPARGILKLAAAPQSLAGADVLILSPHDNVTLWEKYKTFRESTAAGASLTFKVVDLNDVYTAYPFNASNTGGAPRNAAESIHKYLRQNRDSLSVSYVILGGSWIDAQSLDSEGHWLNSSGARIKFPTGADMTLRNCVPGVIAHSKQDAAADMFYACLDLNGLTYPWCDGESTEYFKVQDKVTMPAYDRGVDVIVSRLPLKPVRIGDKDWTSAELMDAFIEKLRRVEGTATEHNFIGTGRLGNLWHNLSDPYGDGISVDASLPYEHEFYDDVLNLFDESRDALYNNGETPSRKMLREHVSKYYPMKEVDSVSPRAWTKGYATSDEAKAAYFAKDRDYGSMESHGYAYFAGSEGFVNTTTFYNSTGLTLLNDFTMLCATGQQNYIGEWWQGYTHSIPCLGEAAVDAPFGGAIASLNNSRDGLTAGENDLSYRVYHEGARKFLHLGGNAGETWLASHLAYAETLGTTGEPGGNLVLVEHTLFGDPFVSSQAFENKDKTFVSETYSVSGVEAYVDATASGNLTLSGNGRLKVLQTLSVGGASFTVADGVEGGVGQKVSFTGTENGAITINTTKRFYLGGVENCSAVVVNGSNVIVDCDNLGEGLSSITFNMTPDATCTLRGLKKGALAGINLVVNGGTLVFETSDVLDQNRVDLNGATLIVKVDPALGSGHPSAESMNGIFYGSGKLVCQRGTEALKKWNRQSASIVVDTFGKIEPAFEYSGVVGSSPSGWFNAWKGEAFDDNKSVLAPNGFVRVVENQHHPFAALPDREMITLALFADLSKVADTHETVLLSIGNSNSNTSNQLLLTRGTDRKIRLYYTSPMGYYQRTKGIVVDDPGEGFHLYVIERTGSSLKLVVDGTEYVENDDVSSYKLEPYLQIGSQYWYLQNNRAAADGMVVAALRGYDVIIDNKEMASLVREFPAAAYPLAITKPISFAQSNEATATLASSVFAAEASLKVAKGRVEVPMGTTVTVPKLEFADGSSTDDRAVVAVAGTLNAGEIVLNGRGTQTLDLCGGRLVATADWKVTLPINVTADSTLDSNGHDLILSGSISGSANLTITGAGSVTILSDLSHYSGKITVASNVTKFGVRREYVESRQKIVFATRPATLIVALSAEQLQSSYTASGYAGYVSAGSKIVFTDYDGYIYQETAGTTIYAPWQSLTYRYDDIDWSYVYLPYERGKWDPLINWRSLSSNISETNSVQMFTTGAAPLMSSSNRWEPAILNGAEFEGEKDADGFYDVRAEQLEGWNLKLGVYNGVHLTVGKQVKFQMDSEQYLRVGSNSRVTFESFGTGNSNDTLPIYVASTDGVVFKTDVPNISYSYHLAKNATVKFEQGLSCGTHTIAACEAALSDPTGKTKYNINAVKLFDFNGKGSSASITLGANALTLKNAAGGTVVARKFDNSLEMYKDAIANHRVGGYTLLPGDAGLYLAYIDYAETSPTEITISGLQTNLDLTNIPDGIRKIRLVNARGYFKNSTHKVETTVEFTDSASGRLAFEWTDGYSDKIVEFSHATGSGTIQSATKQGQMMVFGAESDYCGSLVLTNSGARVCFGATNIIDRLQSCSCIVVHKNHTAHLKDGGIWAVGDLQQGEIRIDGELACAGSAEIICMPGISGVENITIPDNYTKSLLTVTPDANPSAMRAVRVWVLPEGEIPTAEGQLGLGVTDSTITLPSFDMGAHALRIYAGIVKVGADAAVRAPTVQVLEGSFVAAAKIGDTYYGSFAKAVASARKDDVIELLSNVEYEMAADQVLKVRKNGHFFTHPENPGLEYNENEEDGVTTVLCATAIYTISYNVRYAGFAEFERVADLEPDEFALSQLPLGLPRLSEETAVFHGWYWDEACEGEAMTELPKNLPKIEIKLYGYFNPAVARVNGVLCETWEEAFAEQARTHYSIDVIGAPQLPDGYMVERGTLVRVMATLQVGESKIDYSSLLEAYNASKIETDPIIILKADAPSALTIGLNETLSVKLNGHVLAVVSANTDTHIIRATLDANTGVTTYRSLLAVAKIGANRYATLSDAVANLGAADTIEILADIDSESIALTKNTTFNVQTNCTLSAILSGGHSLTKTGAGTLTINAEQTLTGDFIVAEGKVEASKAVRAKNADAYVEVREGASLKFTKNVQLDCQYAFKLAGDGVNHEGALVFSASESWYNAQIKSITLAGDATITAAMSAGGAGLIGSGYSATSIELNGHTLTKKGAMPFFLYNTTVSDSSVEKTGKVVVEEGTLEIVQYPGMTYVTTFNAPVVGNLNIQAPICVNVPANRTWTITAVTIGNTASTATLAEGASLVATTGLFTSVTTDLVEKKVVKTTNASHDTYTLETKTYTVTVPSVENTTYLVQVSGEAVEIRNGTITVNHGDRVVVTYSAAEGYAMAEVTKTIESVTTGSSIDVSSITPVRKTFTVNVPLTTGLAVAITPDRATDIEGGKSIVADYSETVTVTYTANGDYILSGTLEQTFTYSASTQTAVAPTATLAAAKIGTTLYATINDALAHASDGEIVYISGDVPDTHKIVDGKVVAKKYYAVTCGDHAHAVVSGIPTSVEEDDPAITFTVSPAESHNLIAVKANGTALVANTNGSYTIKIFANTEIIVETEIKKFTVVLKTIAHTTCYVKVNSGTEIVYEGAFTVNYGDRVDFRYEAIEGYSIDGGTDYHYSNIKSNITETTGTITATTTCKTFNVTAPTGTGVTVSATEVTADYSETVTITYALKTNYILKSGDLVQTFTYSSEPQQATLPVVELRSPGEVTATSFSFDVFKIGDTVVELMDGDTIVVPANCIGDQWHPTLTNIANYDLKIRKSMNLEMDINKAVEIDGAAVVVHAYAWTSFGAGAEIKGTGSLRVCNTVSVNGAMTITSSVLWDDPNYATPGKFKLNEGGSIVVSPKFDDDKVVSGVDGKMVEYSEGKYELSLIAAKIGGKPYASVQDAINALTDEQSVSDIVIVDSSAMIPAGYTKVTTGDVVTLRAVGGKVYYKSGDWTDSCTVWADADHTSTTTFNVADTMVFTAEASVYPDHGMTSALKIDVAANTTVNIGHEGSGVWSNLPSGSTIELGDGAQVVFQYWGNNSIQGTATLGDITINGAKGTYSYNSNRTHPPTFGVVTGSAKLVLGEGQSVTATSFETFPISGVAHKHVVCNGTTYSLALDRFSVVIPEITGAVAKVNGETASGSITVDYGTTITIVYEPTTGHQIGEPASVQVGPVEADIAEIDVSAIAVSKILVAVTIPEVANTTPSVEGYEIVNGVVTVPYGESIRITYTANDGYQIVGDGSLVIENITENQSPAAPSMSVTYAPDRMLYCFHLDGNTDNDGLATLNSDYKVTKDGSSYSCFTSTNVRFGTNAVGGGSLGSAGTYYVTAPTVGDALVDADSDWTLSMWVNYGGGTTMWGNVGGFSIGENCFRIQRTDQNTFQLYCDQEDFIGNTDASKAVPAGTTSDWRNLVFVFHASTHTLDIYSNAEKWGSVARDGFAGKALTSISMGNYVLSSIAGGTLTKDARNYYGSAIDEVAVFNAALSANQIAWLAANKPSEDVFDVSAHPTPFGSKVIGLSDGDECQFWSDGDTIKSRVGHKYDQVVVTVLVNLPVTTTEARLMTVNVSANEGASVNKLDLYWDGTKLYLGHSGSTKDTSKSVAVDAGLHLISFTAINGQVKTGDCGSWIVVDGDEKKKVVQSGYRWGGNYPTGTFTYQGDIKSITLDFSSTPVSGLATLPLITENGKLIEKSAANLEKIEEILTMTGKRIDEGDISLDVSLGSFVETGAADTIGITVGTSLDLPNGEVTILVEDPDHKGKFVDLRTVDPLVGPTADPALHDAGNKLVVPINSLLGSAKSRLFKIQAKPKQK